MNKIGCLIAFFIFLVVAIIYDCIDSNRRNEDREKYDSLEKRLMEYVNENDFETAYNKGKRNGKGVDIHGYCRINSKDRKSVSRRL